MRSPNTRSGDPEVLYGCKAIAGMLGVERRQAFHMIEAGGLPTFKIGRMVCARPEAVRSWLAEREAAGRAPPAKA